MSGETETKREFGELIGYLVRVVYLDGDKVAVAKGELVDETESYVKVRSLDHLTFIRKSTIQKIKLNLNEQVGNSGRGS
ncbi:MAG: hypothetical protein ABH852_00365 [Methanobacteriota archaeon]